MHQVDKLLLPYSIGNLLIKGIQIPVYIIIDPILYIIPMTSSSTIYMNR